VYVIVSPLSLDLAAHLFRAKLFGVEGFGIWNNWWYAGHSTPGYSVLFPPVAYALSPQLAAAVAATVTAALFEALVYPRFGRDGWLGALWFGAATATNLYTGRLAFAFAAMFGVGAVLALQRRRASLAALLGVLTALASPVAALFVALAGAAYAVSRYADERNRGNDADPGADKHAMPNKSHRGTVVSRGPAAVLSRNRPIGPGAGVATAVAALVPVLALAVLFPEGGNEPFIFMTLWPIPLICLAALYAFPKRDGAIRAGAIIYALACIAAYLVPTPAGSNVARLAPFIAGPLAALALWPARKRLLLAVAIPLLYLQVQAPIRDVSTAAGDPSANASYWRPLLSFLDRQGGPPFRLEIPFTGFHWEAYEVAPRFPLARGWERQLDIKYNGLFYSGRLTAARYDAWLHRLAVRFVAVPEVRLDYSARQEEALIDRGLPYLRPVASLVHWRIYAVADPTPIAQGAGRLIDLAADSFTLRASRPGRTLVRVRFTPYWAIADGSGCVRPDGEFTAVTLDRAGDVRIVTRFSASRIEARSPRCTP
jgi:hypothetical protein